MYSVCSYLLLHTCIHQPIHTVRPPPAGYIHVPRRQHLAAAKQAGVQELRASDVDVRAAWAKTSRPNAHSASGQLAPCNRCQGPSSPNGCQSSVRGSLVVAHSLALALPPLSPEKGPIASPCLASLLAARKPGARRRSCAQEKGPGY